VYAIFGTKSKSANKYRSDSRDETHDSFFILIKRRSILQVQPKIGKDNGWRTFVRLWADLTLQTGVMHILSTTNQKPQPCGNVSPGTVLCESIYIYVYIYIYIYIYMHTHTHTRARAHTHTHTHTQNTQPWQSGMSEIEDFEKRWSNYNRNSNLRSLTRREYCEFFLHNIYPPFARLKSCESPVKWVF